MMKHDPPPPPPSPASPPALPPAPPPPSLTPTHAVGFVIIFATLFSKVWRINKIFNRTDMRRKRVRILDVV
jgi:hypothetical protein